MFAYTKIMQALVAAGVTPASTDPYFNLVTLLLNTTTTNGAQNNTFLDSSTANAGSGWTITRNGNTTQGTFTPFSQTGWSNYFPTTSDFLGFASSSGGSLDLSQVSTFTVEAWVYLNGYSSNQNTIIGSRGTSSVGWEFRVNSTGTLQGYATGGGSLTSSSTVAINSWNHVVFVRSGSNAYLYLNGTQIATTASFTNGTNTANTVYIGIALGTANSGINGYVSNLRILNGTALYTGSTYTVPTAPLTTTSQGATNCKLLTCQSNRFIDNSATPFTASITGTPSVQAFSPFAPTAAYSTTTVGGSGYFDGSGDWLSITETSSQFTFGTNDYEYSCWIYPTDSSTVQKTIFGRTSSGNTAFPYIYLVGTTQVVSVYYSAAIVSGTTAIKPFTWTYIVVSRVSGTTRIFVNGVQEGSASDTTNLISPTAIVIGNNGTAATTNPFFGYISGARILKGSGSTSVTVPTAPPTAITNTQLLANFTNAGIYDAAAKNDLETVGNAQVSTTQAKFGTTSMYFDGTGDWLVGPRSWSVAANENFTVEGWFYFGATVSTTRMILSDYNSGTPGASKYFSVNATGVELQFGSIAATVVTSTTSFSINTWYHIAAVRNNNTVSIYVNGTAQSVTNSTQSNAFLDQGTILYVGRWGGTTTYEWIGYMDELRFTKGVARYTANFSVPTAAFPVQ